MLESFGSSDTLGRVDGQHAVDEVLGFISDSVPLWRWILSTKTTTAQTE